MALGYVVNPRGGNDRTYSRRRLRVPGPLLPDSADHFLKRESRGLGFLRESLPELRLGPFYEIDSAATHVSTPDYHIEYKPGVVVVKPIRSIDGLAGTFMQACNLALHSYEVLIQSYRPGEYTAFRRTYFEKWRGPLMSIPTVQVKHHRI